VAPTTARRTIAAKLARAWLLAKIVKISNFFAQQLGAGAPAATRNPAPQNLRLMLPLATRRSECGKIFSVAVLVAVIIMVANYFAKLFNTNI
jgi:hypothetical protein